VKKRFAAGVALGAFFLWLALRHVDFAEIAATLRRASYLEFALFVLMHVVVFWPRALRWSILMRPVKRIPTRRFLPPLCVGFMVNFLFPARAGEVVRAFLIGRAEGVSKSAAFATIVVERLFDGLAIFTFLAPAPFLLPAGQYAALGRLRWAAPAILGVYVAVLVALFVLSHRHEAFNAFLARSPLVRRHPLAARLAHVVQQFTEGLAILKSWRAVAAAVTLSLGQWGFSALGNLLMMHAIGLALPWYAPFFLLVLQGFGVLIPSPGFVGPFQYAHVVALGVYGVSQSLAMSLALLIHAGIFIAILGCGFFFAAREHLGVGDIRKVSEEPG
jgi:uncharacterized protein (TIRG00374 family)